MRCLLVGITAVMLAGCVDGRVPSADAGPCPVEGFERHADGRCLCSSDQPACTIGQVCVSGLCVVGCRVTSDCGDGEMCLIATGHEAGQCVEEPVIDPCVDVVAVHEGDLTITTSEDVATLTGLAEVSGDLILASDEGVTQISINCLRAVGGSLRVQTAGLRTLSMASLEVVQGGLRLAYNDELTDLALPLLATLGGSLDLHVNPALASVSLDALTEVGGTIVLMETALESFSLPALTSVADENPTAMVGRPGVWMTGNHSLTSVTFAALRQTTFRIDLEGNYRLRRFSLPQAVQVAFLSIEDSRDLDVLSLPLVEQIDALHLRHFNLTTFDLPGATIGDLSLAGNAVLTHLALPETTITGDISLLGLSALTEITLPGATEIGGLDVQGNDALRILSLPSIIEISGRMVISHNPALTSVVLASLTRAKGIYFYTNPELTETSLPQLTRVGVWGFGWVGNVALERIVLPSLREADSIGVGRDRGLDEVDGLIHFEAPVLETLNSLKFWEAENLTSVRLPRLTSLGSLTLWSNPILETFALPALREVGSLRIWINPMLVDFELPLLETAEWNIQFTQNPSLRTISLPALTTGYGFSVTETLVLSTLALPALRELTANLSVIDNPALPQCLVDALIAQIEGRLGIAGTTSAQDNRTGCTCAEQAGLVTARCP